MKRLYTSILAFLMALTIWAEAPQTISYQAVVRNNVGRLLREKPVGVRITILQGDENGKVVYTESRVATTNNNGLLTFAIGDDQAETNDNLAKIDWANHTYYLRCEMDPDGGNSYTLNSTSQMASVPYALYAKNIAPEALPSWAQSDEKPVYNYTEIVNAPDVPTKVSQLENDKKYITLKEVPEVTVPTKVSELENDKKYITLKEIPTVTVPTKVSELENDAKYLTEHQSLKDYAKKSDLPTVPTKVSDLINDAGYITESNVTTTLNTINVSELKNDANYITSADVPTKVSAFENDANYLTEHQSLEGYAKTTDIPSLDEYAKKSELPSTEGLLSEADAAATYQPKGEYLTEHQSLKDYAKKSELPTIPTKVSAFENDKNYLTEHQSLEGYAKTTDIPSLEDYAKKSELPSTEGLLSEATAATTYQPKGEYLTEHQSLDEYAKKSDLPSTEGLLSEAIAAATYQPKGEYLTEHQSLDEYAKKSELPAVPTKVGTFENDVNYITKAVFDSVVANYNVILAKYTKKMDSLIAEMDSVRGLSDGSKRTVKIDNGALPGLFSVSADKQVKFSMGNLQYQASTNSWRFAENQYDVVGSDNENISATYSGWIDLFGWATSGYHNSSDGYNRNYMPYSSSNTEVNTTYNYYGYGPSSNQTTKSLVFSSAEYDWGIYNAISNGGNEKEKWRVMSSNEWSYLYSGRVNAANLRTKATVDGISGYVFFPDNWEQSDDVSVELDASEFANNNYSIIKWNVLEAQGAVFLPAAGYRNVTAVGSVGTSGNYWSSTYANRASKDTSLFAYGFNFSSSNVNTGFENRYLGLSVRLVQ